MNELIPTTPPAIPPIDSDAALAAAVTEIDGLIDKDVKGDLTPVEDARLESLGDAVIAYEDEHHPMESVSDSAMLAHLLEARGWEEPDLVTKLTIIFAQTVVDVLAGRREFEPCEAEIVAKAFGVKPELFRSYEAQAKAKEAAR